MQGKLSQRTWHYPRCTGEAIVAYLALSKGGSRVHYPRVDLEATIQGWPLSKGGTYPRVATIQGWPLCKGGSWVHYPRVATIEGLASIQGLAVLPTPETPFQLFAKGLIRGGGDTMGVGSRAGARDGTGYFNPSRVFRPRSGIVPK